MDYINRGEPEMAIVNIDQFLNKEKNLKKLKIYEIQKLKLLKALC